MAACLAVLAPGELGAAFAAKAVQPPSRPAKVGRGGRTPRGPGAPSVAPAQAPAPARSSAPASPAGPASAPAAATPPAAAATPAAAAPGPLPTPGASPAAQPDCLAQLRADGVEVELASQPASAGPSCTIDTPVRLLSVADPNDAGRRIAFPEKPLVACRVALPFAQWTARIAAPVLKAGLGSPLKAVPTGPGYECRGRNRQAGGKMSAHALGLALDVAGFDLADGRSLSVKGIGQDRVTAASFSSLRTAACGWFTTVLGPGSDSFHDDHLHLDIQLHGSSDRYRICQ